MTEDYHVRYIIAGIRALLVVGIASLATCTSSWCEETEIRLSTLAGHTHVVSGIAYSPDGRWLLSSSWDGTARLWDSRSGREVRQFPGFGKSILASAFTPDGSKVLTAGYDTAAHLWDLKTGNELVRIWGHTAPIQAVSISRSGLLFATGAGHVPADVVQDPTVRIWRISDGKELSVLSGHTSSVRAVAVLPGDTFAVSAGADGTVRRWDLRTNQEVASSNLGNCSVSSLVTSPDGSWIAIGMEPGCGKAVAILDARTLQILSRFGEGGAMTIGLSPSGDSLALASIDGSLGVWRVKDASLRAHLPKPVFRLPWRAVAFSPDGNSLSVGGDSGTVTTLRTIDLSEIRTFGGRADPVLGVSVSGDGRWLATALDGRRAALWDVTLGRQTRIFTIPSELLSVATLSHDGSLLATGAGTLDPRMKTAAMDASVRVWSTSNGQPVARLQGHFDVVTQVYFLPGGKQLASASMDGTVRLWDLATGMEMQRFSAPGEQFLALAMSPDGRTLAVGTQGGSAIAWDVPSARKLSTMRGPSTGTNSLGGRVLFRMAAVRFSADGSSLWTGSDDGVVREWDHTSGTILRAHPVGSAISALVSTPDGQALIAGCLDGEVRVLDAASGSITRHLVGHEGPVLGVAATDERILSASSDRTVRVWEAHSGTDLAKLFSFTGGSWAVIDSQGYFDEPNAGTGSDLYWVAGLQTIDLSQFKQRYYLPGLLARRFSASTTPPGDRPVLRRVALGPEIRLSSRASNAEPARLSFTNQGGGIGRIRVRVDGKMVIEDGKAIYSGKEASLELTQAALSQWLLPGGTSDIEVQAYNGEGSLLGPPLMFAMSRPGSPIRPEMPRLWVIAIGVSEYVGSDGAFDLTYAANDAKDMAQVLRMGGEALFGKPNIDIQLLASGGSPGVRPTKANIQAAFARLKDAAPSDVIVVYFSGHGLSIKDEYYFPTEEVNSLDISDPAVRSARTISGDEIGRWMTTRARKQAIVLDTCSAGAVGKQLVRDKGFSPEAVRGLERARDRAGLFVLMGSAADKEAYEASPYERGLLTHALLEGMRGASALRDGSLVSVAPLFDFAKEQVQDLASEVGGVQIPFVFAPLQKSESFYIGSMDSALRNKVPYHARKPLLLRPTVINSRTLSDDLRMSVQLTDALRRGASADGVGKAAYAFYDVGEMNGGITPAGLYTITDGVVSLKLRLAGRGRSESLTVNCDSNQVQSCVSKAAISIKALVKQ